MATITTIAAGDLISNSRTDINSNFSALNSDKIETSTLDTDTTLAANSDARIATQKAVKAYVDAGGNVNASTTAKGIVEEATAAEVAAKTAAGGTGARLFMNPSTAGPFFATTQVYASAAAPTSYTDLDLSAVVGTAQRIVMLRVLTAGTNSANIRFRRNGESTAVVTPNGGGGGTSAILFPAAAAIGYVLVVTDSSGIVEWLDTAGNSVAITVNVEAYW